MVVAKWVASITHTDSSTTHARNRGRVMWAIACLDTVFSSAPYWLSDHDLEQVRLAQSVLFPAWDALHSEAGDGRWPVISLCKTPITLSNHTNRTRHIDTSPNHTPIYH